MTGMIFMVFPCRYVDVTDKKGYLTPSRYCQFLVARHKALFWVAKPLRFRGGASKVDTELKA